MLLEAQGVSRAFGGFTALADADLTVAAGEIVGLIGPNGAGKSTFFNCIAGDLAPTGGRILFDGVDVTGLPPEQHAQLGIGRTFQVPATFEDMTILENVMVGAFLRHPHRNDAREHARRIVELTGLRGDQQPVVERVRQQLLHAVPRLLALQVAEHHFQVAAELPQPLPARAASGRRCR